MEREIIILAKSSKHGGYCVAGIDTSTGKWIRPISNNAENEGAVPAVDLTYEDKTQVQVFDKVKIKFSKHIPSKAQPENYEYDDSVYWKKTGESTLQSIIKDRGYDKPDKIFYNNDRVVADSEVGGEPSLLLVNIEDSEIFIKTFSDNRKLQFNFNYNGIEYKFFQISDKEIGKQYSDYSDGAYKLKRNLAVVFSLTDKYQMTGKYYKMVAQMFY